MRVAWPASASSTALSRISLARWVEALGVGRPDVHARALADGLEALEHRQVLGVVAALAVAGAAAAAGLVTARPLSQVLRAGPVDRHGDRAATGCERVRDLALLPKAHLHLHLAGGDAAGDAGRAGRRAGPAAAGRAARPEPAPASTSRPAAAGRASSGCTTPPATWSPARTRCAGWCGRSPRTSAAAGSRWVEVQVDPSSYAARLGGLQATVELVLDAMARGDARRPGVGMALVVAANRTRHPADAETLARLARALRRRGGVVGFGLSNDETAGPPGGVRQGVPDRPRRRAAVGAPRRRAARARASVRGRGRGAAAPTGSATACGRSRTRARSRCSPSAAWCSRSARPPTSRSASPGAVELVPVRQLQDAGRAGRARRRRPAAVPVRACSSSTPPSATSRACPTARWPAWPPTPSGGARRRDGAQGRAARRHRRLARPPPTRVSRRWPERWRSARTRDRRCGLLATRVITGTMGHARHTTRRIRRPRPLGKAHLVHQEAPCPPACCTSTRVRPRCAPTSSGRWQPSSARVPAWSGRTSRPLPVSCAPRSTGAAGPAPRAGSPLPCAAGRCCATR